MRLGLIVKTENLWEGDGELKNIKSLCVKNARVKFIC